MVNEVVHDSLETGIRKAHCASLEVLVLLGIESVGVNATANPTTSLEDVDLVTALLQKKGGVKASDAGSNDANSKRCLRHVWGRVVNTNLDTLMG